MKKGNLFTLVYTLFLIFSININAQLDPVESKLYSWPDTKTTENGNVNKILMFEGETTDLESLQVHSIEIKSGTSYPDEQTDLKKEKLIIIKEGILTFTLGQSEHNLGSSSVAVVLPNDEFNITNDTDTVARFYLFEYTSKDDVDIERGIADGGSFVIDWNDLVFKPHDRGGIRQYFERSTAMFHRFEMHVTTLRSGINSHAPHVHTSDEMVLMISGNSTLHVGESSFNAAAGDLIFLGADKPHALENNSGSNCMYFAFHGE